MNNIKPHKWKWKRHCWALSISYYNTYNTTPECFQKVSSSTLVPNQGSSSAVPPHVGHTSHVGHVGHTGHDWKYEVEVGKTDSRMTSFDDDDDEGPEIIDLQPTLAIQINKQVSWTIEKTSFQQKTFIFVKSFSESSKSECSKLA